MAYYNEIKANTMWRELICHLRMAEGVGLFFFLGAKRLI